MDKLFEEPRTHRLKDGSLVTRGRPKVQWARVSTTGKIHLVLHVIIRWNFHGGTYERPDVTFVLACGPQNHTLFPTDRVPGAVCARCDRKWIRLDNSIRDDIASSCNRPIDRED